MFLGIIGGALDKLTRISVGNFFFGSGFHHVPRRRSLNEQMATGNKFNKRPPFLRSAPLLPWLPEVAKQTIKHFEFDFLCWVVGGGFEYGPKIFAITPRIMDDKVLVLVFASLSCQHTTGANPHETENQVEIRIVCRHDIQDDAVLCCCWCLCWSLGTVAKFPGHKWGPPFGEAKGRSLIYFRGILSGGQPRFARVKGSCQYIQRFRYPNNHSGYFIGS